MRAPRHMLFATVLVLVALAGGAYVLATYGPTVTSLFRQPSLAGASPRASGRLGAPQRTAARRHAMASKRRRERSSHPRRPSASSTGRLLESLALGAAAGLGLMMAGCALTVRRRFANRRSRRYERYAIRLSMHDEAKPKDLDDMIEAIAGALRPPRSRRWQQGQPFVALELIYRPGAGGMEWTLCLLCERRIAATLEGIIAQAYPDTWLGRGFDELTPAGVEPLEVPGWVLRLRKRRPYLYPLSRPIERTASRERKPSSPLEGIARAQVAAGTPSVVRFQLMPVIEGFERRARERLRHRERDASRTWRGHREGLTLSERAELTSAVEVQDRALFHLEVQVGARDWDTANAVAASVMARRGENHLHRRYMLLRQGMYRRRFPTAYPPWFPPLSRRDIVSGGEIAYLFELPSARMKGVPVRRLTRPRIPAPPEMARTRRSEVPTCKASPNAGHAGARAAGLDCAALFGEAAE